METKNTLETVEEAIIGFAQDHNGRLPGTLSQLSTKTTDAYGEALLYYTGSQYICSPPPGSISVPLSVNDTGSLKSNVAFLVMSKGANHCDQTKETTNKFHIYQQGVIITAPGCPSREYDDQVVYRDIDSLRAMMCEPLKITTNSLPEGQVGQPYPHTQLSATGGAPPYTWSCNPNPPVIGLICNLHGTISGIPSVTGSYPVTITLTDQEGRSAIKTLSITIQP